MAAPARLVHPDLTDRAHGGATRSVGLGFGCDYNPEQWPEAVWDEDVGADGRGGRDLRDRRRLLLGADRAGPRPTRPRLARARARPDAPPRHRGGPRHRDRLAAALADHAPPRGPAGRPPRGDRSSHGSRQAWCPSSPVFREHALALVEDVAAHFAGHPALVLWHVSNELGCHNAHCYCDVSAAAFRRWLRASGTDRRARSTRRGAPASGRSTTTSGRRSCRPGSRWRSPTRRSSSTSVGSAPTSCSSTTAAEREVLRRHTPDVPVTTNFMVTQPHRRPGLLALGARAGRRQQRPLPRRPARGPDVELALAADWTRGLAGGTPVGADGALDQRGQLAAAQLRQGSGPDAAQQPAARGPRG